LILLVNQSTIIKQFYQSLEKKQPVSIPDEAYILTKLHNQGEGVNMGTFDCLNYHKIVKPVEFQLKKKPEQENT
jgi:hypothetical protein